MARALGKRSGKSGVARALRWLLTAGVGLGGLIAMGACSDDTAGDETASGGGNNNGCSGATQCGSECVDIDVDPNNCGACGRSCVILNGEAACEAGECLLDRCQTGWADCDSDISNGCELAVDCQEGKSCTTTCDSVGSLACADACAPVCNTPVEACNGLDDNCDGSCDEGSLSGCRVGLHRSHGPLGHFYTADEAEAVGFGQSIEFLNYFYLYNNAAIDLRPLFRCKKGNNKRFLTTSTDCDQTGGPEKTVGFIAPQQECGATALYATRNVGGDAHFYTVSEPEKDNAVNNLGFQDLGILGYVWIAP